MQHLSRMVVLVVAAVAIVEMLAAAQAPTQKPQFEVATVKPTNRRGCMIPQPGWSLHGSRPIPENLNCLCLPP